MLISLPVVSLIIVTLLVLYYDTVDFFKSLAYIYNLTVYITCLTVWKYKTHPHWCYSPLWWENQSSSRARRVNQIYIYVIQVDFNLM